MLSRRKYPGQKSHSSRKPTRPYVDPTILYLVRWLEFPRKWKQNGFNSLEEAQTQIDTIERLRGTGEFANVREFSPQFTDSKPVIGRRGPPTGRYIVKWKDRGRAHMVICPTEANARIEHRQLYDRYHQKAEFWICPTIHCRLT